MSATGDGRPADRRPQEGGLAAGARARAGGGAAGGRRGRMAGWLFFLAMDLACGLFLLVVAGIFLELLAGSWPSIRAFGLSFLWTSAWDPVAGKFGALPFIYGTLVSSLVAIALAAGVGLLAAIYLAEFAPGWLGAPLGLLIELLAAVPSVVYGLWGLFVLSPIVRSQIGPFLQATLGFLPLFSGPIYGVGMLTAILILVLMIVPTVVAVSRDVLLAVPDIQRESMLALGATRWEVTRRVVLPAARGGIFGACVLALGRAVGETIATTMVIGNRPVISASLFAPGYTLASVIANEFTEATTTVYLGALTELGLLLFVLSLIVNGLARVLLRALSGGLRQA